VKVLVAIYSPFASWCIPDAEVEELRREFPEHTFSRADSDEETVERIGDADVVFGSTVSPAQLAAAARLRWIHSPAAGVGGMLFPAMLASTIVMSNSRGNSSVTIAEHVVAVTLALLRDLPLAWRRQQARVWAQDEFDAGARIHLLRGLRVLIVGLGSIGGETARLVSAFGATVVGIRRRPGHSPPPTGVAAVAGPDALAAELKGADVVVISAPQTARTMHLIGERELAIMKDEAILVNVSRGKLIDEAALERALAAGRLRGAALDVFEHEPLDPGSSLWARDNVIVTPHVSGFRRDHWPEARRLFAENLRRFVAGTPLVNEVDKMAGY
jgi:phosphoglycerate dehydrogenase-like enzyme